MALPSPTQWERFSALRERLEPLPLSDRRAQLKVLQAESKDDAQVVSLLALHFSMPVNDSEEGLGAGDRIDDVTLGEPLGAGGMGVVHEAIQDLGGGGRPVAVKLINPLLWRTAPDEARRRFFDEINAQAVLQYDGLARLYRAGTYTDPATDEEAPYLVMELVRGARTITQFAEEHGLELDERLALMQRVCRAVQHAHDHRIIHRDLKPANILVDSDGRPAVVDFGLAQTCDTVLPGATLVASGTPAYMSPEQLSDQFGPISEKTDTYMLGTVLYELLTGQKPYEVTLTGSLDQLQHTITEVPPIPLGQVDALLAGELEHIVSAALSKEPAKRMTVAALGSRIERFLQSAAAEARQAASEPSSWFVRTFDDLGKRKVFLSAAAYSAAGLVAVRAADIILPELTLPDWAVMLVTALALLGFVAVVTTAWTFGIKPHSPQRTAPDTPRQRGTRAGPHRFVDALAIGLLVSVGAYLFVQQAPNSSTVSPSSPAAAPTAPPGSVAVLPLQHLGGDVGDDIFTEGLHIDLISQLATIHALKVTPRAYVLGYDEKGMGLAEIADELGVAALVEGSVRIAGDRVKINMQLHNPVDRQMLWSKSFDRTLTARNLFAVQAELVRAVVDELGATLSPEEEARVDRIPTENTAAYEAYQLSKRYLDKVLYREELGALDAAIALDPNFAEAHAGRARAYIVLARDFPGDFPRAEAFAEASKSLETAFALNPELAAAHASKGLLQFYTYLFSEGRANELEKARSALEKAVELEPTVEAWRRYLAWVLMHSGTPEEVLEHLLAAYNMVPAGRRGDSPRHHPNLIFFLLILNRFEEARYFIQEHIRLHPAWAHYTIATDHQTWGKNAESIVTHERMFENDITASAYTYASLVSAFATLRYFQDAADWIEKGLAATDNRGFICASAVNALAPSPSEEHQRLATQCAEIALAEEQCCALVFLTIRDVQRGLISTALERYELHSPDLLATQPKISYFNSWDAVGLAWLLKHEGDEARADALLERVLQGIDGSIVPSAMWSRAVAYGLLRNDARALDALRDALAAGQIYDWGVATTWPGAFDNLRDHPEFVELHRAFDEEIARQRQRLDKLRAERPTLSELGELLLSTEGNQLSARLSEEGKAEATSR